MRAAMRVASRARAMLRDSEQLLQTYCMVVLATFALGFMLIELKPLLLPLCFAMFISLLYAPLIDLLTCRNQARHMKRNQACRIAAKRKFAFIGDDGQVPPNCWNTFVSSMVDMVSIGKIPKPIAILASICSAFAVLGLVGWIVYDAVEELYERKDEYESRFDELVDEFVGWAGSAGVNITSATVKEELEDLLVNTIAVGAAEGVADFLAQTLLMLVFLIFILFMRSSGTTITKAELVTRPWAAVKYKAQEKVQRYILVKTMISLGTGILVGLMLGLLGAPLPTVFGMLAFLLNFVPSIGSWIATFMPVPVILFDPNQTLATALLAILLPGAVQVIIGDFIEPHFLGKLCQVSPLMVLVSLVLFGYLWGIGGMVLALPITIVIKLVCKQIPHAIPRYIAGLIYGDVSKYKRQLDRQLARLHRTRSGHGKAPGNTPLANPYRTDDESDGNELTATDAQLSHIVMHECDNDSSSSGPPADLVGLHSDDGRGGSHFSGERDRKSIEMTPNGTPRHLDPGAFDTGSLRSLSQSDLVAAAAGAELTGAGDMSPARARHHHNHHVSFAPDTPEPPAEGVPRRRLDAARSAARSAPVLRHVEGPPVSPPQRQQSQQRRQQRQHGLQLQHVSQAGPRARMEALTLSIQHIGSPAARPEAAAAGHDPDPDLAPHPPPSQQPRVHADENGDPLVVVIPPVSATPRDSA